MKLCNKILSWFLSVIMIFSFVPLTASAATISGTCGANLTWCLDENTGVFTISGEGTMENYEDITYSNSPPWEYKKNYIKKVIIENGVTTIGDYAFDMCHNLVEIVIPESVIEIGSYSLFSNGLNNITIPSSVTVLKYRFADYDQDITYKGNSTEWLELRNNNSYSELNKYFVKCLDKMFFPTGSCGENVTWELNPLTNCMTISGIGPMDDSHSYYNQSGIFYHYLGRIHTVIINDGVESIGDYVFASCSELKSVSIPSSITRIGEKAFWRCSNLTNLDLPDGLNEVGDAAFAMCDLLRNIAIPASVIKIGAGAFAAPESIFVAQDNQYYSSDETGVLFNKDKSVLIQYPSNAQNKHYVIPDSVTTIGDAAFLDSGNLTNISMHKGISSIGTKAFMGCTKLGSIKIPAGVDSIPESAFATCKNLKSVDISYGVTTIGRNAFEHCEELENINIPSSVTTIGRYAFSDCYSLSDIIIPDSVTSIGEYAFEQSGIRNIVLGKGLTEIKYDTFYRCTSLREIVIPENVTKIGANAFCWTNVEKVWIPVSVVEIGRSAFSVDDTLENIYYMGTKQQWQKIKISNYYDDFSEAKIHYSCRKTKTNPTCTECGVITYICDCCNATALGGYIAPEGHNYVNTNETVATCTAHGYIQYTCESCGFVSTDYASNPTGHTFNDEGICEVCGEKEVSTSHVNTQMLSFESILAMIMNLLSKILGLFSVA